MSSTVAGEATYTKLWTSAQVTGNFSQYPNWNYYIEPQLRLVDDKYKFGTANLYLGIYYEYTPNLNLYAGIFRSHSQRTDGKIENEYRLWEQVTWNVYKSKTIQILNRTRLEERKNLDESEIANRLRERIAINIPIDMSAYNQLVIADEIFLQLNEPSWVSQRCLAQNRASIGVLMALSPTSSFEIGYLNQYQFQNPNIMSNVLYLYWNKSFA